MFDQQFKSVLQQSPGTKTLLPLTLPEHGGEEQVIYEPDAETVSYADAVLPSLRALRTMLFPDGEARG